MRKGLAQVGRGVQHIGRDNHVIAMIGKALFGRVAFDVQGAVVYEVVLRKLFSRTCQEQRRDVGVDILGAPSRQTWQHE